MKIKLRYHRPLIIGAFIDLTFMIFLSIVFGGGPGIFGLAAFAGKGMKTWMD